MGRERSVKPPCEPCGRSPLRLGGSLLLPTLANEFVFGWRPWRVWRRPESSPPARRRGGSGERRMNLTISLFSPALVDRHAASLAIRGPVWPDAVVHRIIPDSTLRNHERSRATSQTWRPSNVFQAEAAALIPQFSAQLSFQVRARLLGPALGTPSASRLSSTQVAETSYIHASHTAQYRSLTHPGSLPAPAHAPTAAVLTVSS
ncbi:hypothetical protein E2C01_007066 [Portunus trituberculatus]|uniref:Uncharacterized protein n=1 Tax=Portunus trituberculatus TaxID=210409 RepID=A0A5B7CX51_PORTR|nr:hypothetical protein [Portunus trituberculatus]